MSCRVNLFIMVPPCLAEFDGFLLHEEGIVLFWMHEQRLWLHIYKDLSLDIFIEISNFRKIINIVEKMEQNLWKIKKTAAKL